MDDFFWSLEERVMHPCGGMRFAEPWIKSPLITDGQGDPVRDGFVVELTESNSKYNVHRVPFADVSISQEREEALIRLCVQDCNGTNAKQKNDESDVVDIFRCLYRSPDKPLKRFSGFHWLPLTHG